VRFRSAPAERMCDEEREAREKAEKREGREEREES
jgi:hypothetical protein